VRCKICGSEMKLFINGTFDDRHGYPGLFDISRCSECGFYSLSPQLTGSELDDLYTNYYPRRGLEPDQVLEAVTSLASFKDRVAIWANGTNIFCHFYAKPGMKVLDYGCGTGTSLIEIKNLGAEAFGIEVDENIGPIAKALNLTAHIGSLDSSPYPDRYFDLVTLNQVIEHVPDPLKLLVALKAKLKDDGKLMLSCPNVNALSRLLTSKKWLHWHVPYHINHFSRKSIRLLLEQAGLRVLSIKTVTPNLWTILQLHSLLASVNKGERDSSWDPAKTNGEKKVKVLNKQVSLHRKVVKFIAASGKAAVMPYNRLIDLLGLGDSFVIEARVDRTKGEMDPTFQ